MWECEWQYKTANKVELHIRDNFLYRRPITKYELFEERRNCKLFGYAFWISEVPKNLSVKIAYFYLVFKNTRVSQDNQSCKGKSYTKEKEKCSGLKKSWFWAAHYKTVNWTFLFFYVILTWGVFAQKHTTSFKKFQKKISAAFYSQQYAQDEKKTWNPIEMSKQRQWSC